MGVACSACHYVYDLNLDSYFVMSNDAVFERFVYVVYVVNVVQSIAVRGVFTRYEL